MGGGGSPVWVLVLVTKATKRHHDSLACSIAAAPEGVCTKCVPHVAFPLHISELPLQHVEWLRRASPPGLIFSDRALKDTLIPTDTTIFRVVTAVS